jgi:hypothetical protein
MLLTIVMAVSLLTHGANKFAMMIGMENPQIRSHSMQINLADPAKSYIINPDSTGFKLAFGLDGIVLPPSIGYFSAEYTNVTMIEDENGTPKRQKQKINLLFEKCDISNWNIDEHLVHSFLSKTISQLYCVKDD